MDNVALWQCSSEYLGLPCQSTFRHVLNNRQSLGAGTIGQFSADVPNGLNLTPDRENEKTILSEDWCNANQRAYTMTG
jgi:hypothetical protein